MKYLIPVLFLMAGCGDVVYLPLDVSEQANHLCTSMDGVKELSAITACVTNGKFCSTTYQTTLYVTCNKYDAKVSKVIEWESK